MRTVTLGATGLEVTPLAYGTCSSAGLGPGGRAGRQWRAIGHARSLGINSSTPRRPTGSAAPSGCSAWRCGPRLGGDRHQGGLRMDGENLVRDASPGWLRKGRRRPAWTHSHRLHRPVPGALARPANTLAKRLPRWPTPCVRA